MTRPDHEMRPILRIDMQACQTCSACQARTVCRTRAIVQYERGDLPAIDHTRCRSCMVCIPACPFGAVTKVNTGQPTTHDVHPSPEAPPDGCGGYATASAGIAGATEM